MEEKEEQMQSTLTEISNQLGQSDAIQSDMAESMSSIKDSMDLMVTSMKESLALEKRQNLENRRDEAGDVSGASVDDSETPTTGLFAKAKMKVFDIGKMIKDFLISIKTKLLIGAAALLVYVGLKFWEPIKEFFVDLKNAVMYAFDNVVQWFKDIFAWGKEIGTDENGDWKLSTFIWGVIDAAIATISKMWEWVGEQAEKWTLTKLVYDAVDTVIGWVTGLFSWVKTTGTDENGDWNLKTFIFSAIDQVIDWVTGLFDWAKQAGTDENGEFSLTKLVSAAIKGIGEWFGEKLTFLGDLVPDWGWDFIGIVSDMLTGAGKWLGEKFGFSLEDFGPKLSEEWNSIKDVFFGLFSNIGDMIDDVIDKLTGWVSGIANWFFNSEEGTILGGIQLPTLEWPEFDFEEVKKSFKKLLGGLLPDPDSLIAKAIPDKVYEWAGISPSTGESEESPSSESAMSPMEAATESGLYDKDIIGNSEINRDLVATASAAQLQAILDDDDLSKEDTKFVKSALSSKGSSTPPASNSSKSKYDFSGNTDEELQTSLNFVNRRIENQKNESDTPNQKLLERREENKAALEKEIAARKARLEKLREDEKFLKQSISESSINGEDFDPNKHTHMVSAEQYSSQVEQAQKVRSEIETLEGKMNPSVVSVPSPSSVGSISGGNSNELMSNELKKNTPSSSGFSGRGGQPTAIVNAPSQSSVTNNSTTTNVQSGAPASSSNNSNKKSAGFRGRG